MAHIALPIDVPGIMGPLAFRPDAATHLLALAETILRGGYGPATFTRGERQVRDWLRDHPEWQAAGPPRAMAYNSPFVPGMLKYAEVQIPVEPRPRAPAVAPAKP